MLSVLATPILVLKRIPYVVEVVGLPRDGLAGKGNGLVPRLLGWILHNLTQMLVSRSIGTIYVTQHALQEVFPTRGISAAASNVELALSPVDPSTRTELPLHSPVRIGTIGSLATTYKGFDIAIRSIASLRAAGHDCRLQVLGSGDPMSYLALARELGCADAIRFDGIRKGGVAVAEWLDTLDIYIQPSRTEGLPRALIEAMARGLPAVASDVGGIAELLEPRWLVRPGEVTPLMDCLRNLIENDEVRIVAGLKNARRAVDYSTRVLQARRTEFFEAVSKAIEVSKDPTQSKRNRRFQ
jgi:glycosyltransferase involved in cell wall biosynthesis